MCGITAIVGQLEDREAVLSRMTDAVAHRGPDGSGLFVAEGVASVIGG